MKFELLQHTPGCRKLILIFTGWSTNATLYRDVKVEGWDVAVVHDYSDMNFDISVLNGYSTIWLFAWSLGIKAASAVIPSGLITGAYAVNGSLRPVDDEEGIPVAIYEGTLNNLDKRNLTKFRRRMSPDSETYKTLFERDFNEDEIESLRSQLASLRDIKDNGNLPWRKAFIADDDKIFPPENLKRSWGKRSAEIVEMKGAHYLPMAEIISSVIPDPDKIGGKFHSALGSYENHADAQNKIATHLCELLLDRCARHPQSLLEIGPFTGMFTRKYLPALNPGEVDFVDLFPIEPFNLTPKETYHCQDAEKWIENCDREYDVIVSASTIQWFSNIGEFISNCRKHLKPAGILAISSFIAGNLGELDAFRPVPLHYPTVENYENWLKANFSNYAIETEELVMKFRNKRELLMHLKHTGVSAAGNSTGAKISLPENFNTLTYRPIYIIAEV